MSDEITTAPAEPVKRGIPPLVKYAAVLLLGAGLMAGALAVPIVGQAQRIDAQASTIEQRDDRLYNVKLGEKKAQDAAAACSYAAGFYRQAADEYYAAGQATARGIGQIFDDYSQELAATKQYVSAGKTAYDTATSLGCEESGIIVSK